MKQPWKNRPGTGSTDNALFPKEQSMIDSMPMPRSDDERANLRLIVNNVYKEETDPKKCETLRNMAKHWGVDID
jgi:hypothetical protein